MLSILIFLAVGQAVSPDHGIYGGFTPQWVCPKVDAGAIPAAQVSLTIGSAVIDGFQTWTAPASLPNDITAITPLVPDANTRDGLSYVAYCYVADVTGSGSTGSPWFQSSIGTPTHYFDFVCEANDGTHFYQPTPDGHPTDGLSYPPGVGDFTTSHAVFVGSVDVTNIYSSACGYGAANGGTSVVPFYRNGSQVIYDTNTTCQYTYSVDAGADAGYGTCGSAQSAWDLGIPSGAIRGTKEVDPDPGQFGFDFTADGLQDVFPLSASKVILDVEGHSDTSEISTTLCFLDPNIPGINLAMARSCQSELMMDAASNGDTNFIPFFPFRTSLNLGLGAGGSYGKFWVGGATLSTSTAGSQTYFDLSFRGYVEPERQLVPQATIPLGR